ncbi:MULTISPECIES: DUF397 domain-containing protein [Streptomyces]|uniref:DUF397 domain-containing protein n=5 Tax=Streptomyces TaxID=1883 RepID=M3DSN2_STREZ|nr:MULTISPECIES: DUF397 domain-containing protein [Streptomyces]MCM3299677.1 DUF397 domain-containing protein [Streptomyces pseudogriseolus]MDT6984507.1 DUF397 domain-containing protein [Streptomyces lusitanus]GGQ31787.1 DUF397 domain-containing protein [Streptomyces gancidicus]EMF24612.1 hypothetical protein H114_27808 [Streptomyces gancidicus BKS 13-15]MCI4142973.1 DUF397 domain-containing protein [Streptomyces sp. MMS20-AI2-20]
MAIRLGATETWTTSSYTNNNGACVMVRSTTEEALELGDTKIPEGPKLAFPADAWNAFVTSVKS